MINFLKSIISIFPPELSHSITINILKMTANFQKSYQIWEIFMLMMLSLAPTDLMHL